MENREDYFVNLMNESNNVDDLELCSPIGEQEFPIEDASSPVRKSQKRSTNYSEKEDEALVLAWQNISLDAVHGNEQSRATYWKRIHAYFNEHKECESDRNVSSLTHRWSTIQECVNKFVGCYEQIDRRRQSGVTLQDKVSQYLCILLVNVYVR